MFPQMRPEAMTPLQLEMLAKQGLEGVDVSHAAAILSFSGLYWRSC